VFARARLIISHYFWPDVAHIFQCVCGQYFAS
jgi:hypothetical protein